jgi:hypothetical protein
MKRPRPAMYKVSEEMKAWSAALTDEVRTWPEVTLKPMFGMFGVYRRRKIFAVLPRTRTMSLPDSIGFKLVPGNSRLRGQARRDPKVHFTEGDEPKWLVFEIACDEDLRGALKWLERAYQETQ